MVPNFYILLVRQYILERYDGYDRYPTFIYTSSLNRKIYIICYRKYEHLHEATGGPRWDVVGFSTSNCTRGNIFIYLR